MKENIHIFRDKNGTPHVEAASREDMFWGQGYVHGRDRGMQMLLMRVLGQGRLCELLNDSEESLSTDIFFRRMNWHKNLNSEFEKLSPKHKNFMEAYTEGANAAFSEKTPWEFKLLGYKPEKWTPLDPIIISRMVGYLSLAQSQAEIERLFVEMVQADISLEKLEELFPGNLGDLDIDLLKKVQLSERIVNPSSLWNLAAPRVMASNNWVVSGSRTKSGKPILANDPHLEINRLPNVWCEIYLSSGDRYVSGGSMPGAPGVFVGRSPDLAWGVTYAFVDAVDSWIEDCKDGKYLKGNEWLNFKARPETIKRKKHADVNIDFFENSHGTLDGDPHQAGYYLATRWTATDSGAVTFEAFCDIAEATTVTEGMKTLGKIESGWNYILADTAGNIGYQMTGKVPKRRSGISGFVPLPGWETKNDWERYLSIEEMPQTLNPESGFFATANEDLNRYGKEKPINMPMGSYRADRINDLLTKQREFSIDDNFAMHADVYSLQAELFMEILKPVLPDTPQGNLLRNWDLHYDVESQGAYLFEAFYEELFREVFGRNGIGVDALDFIHAETGTFIDFYRNFDRILLSEKSNWFGALSREELYRRVSEKALKITPKTWGSRQKFIMSHILFGGTMPSFLGFDHGPITSPGGRATIHQGQIYRSAGRTTTFMPSLRIVTDLAEEKIYSNIAGGPSDRRFSKWYLSDLENYLNYRYKATSPEVEEKLPL